MTRASSFYRSEPTGSERLTAAKLPSCENPHKTIQKSRVAAVKRKERRVRKLVFSTIEKGDL